MLIHIRDDENGGALCETPAARPTLDVRAIVALRPSSSSQTAVCVACIVAGDFYMPPSMRSTIRGRENAIARELGDVSAPARR